MNKSKIPPEIFLSYANNSFREDPQNLSKVFDSIIPRLHSDINDGALPWFKWEVGELISWTIFFSKCHSGGMDGADSLKMKDDKIKEAQQSPFTPVINTAHITIFGFEENFCDGRYSPLSCPPDGKSCLFESDYTELKRVGFIGSEEKLNCFECSQARFIYMLSTITEGLSYEELRRGLFGGLMRNQDEFIKKEIYAKDNYLKEKTHIDIIRLLFGGSDDTTTIKLGGYLNSVAGNSLVGFLLENNRKKLQACQRCTKFFIRSKNDNRIKNCTDCSGKSTLSRERRNEYMREYRKRQKQNELLVRREARIENLMKRAGCSREEAIEYIEADEAMEAE